VALIALCSKGIPANLANRLVMDGGSRASAAVAALPSQARALPHPCTPPPPAPPPFQACLGVVACNQPGDGAPPILTHLQATRAAAMRCIAINQQGGSHGNRVAELELRHLPRHKRRHRATAICLR
jgi:hypothetical protein